MRAFLAFLLLMLLTVACVHQPSTESRVPVALGDDVATVCQKMRSLGARDVTAETKFQFYGQYMGPQKYYWWELKDGTVVAVSLVGSTEEALKVVTIEIGEPGKGVAGIANWRSQKLTVIETGGPKTAGAP
jgi:hypothetical protein